MEGSEKALQQLPSCSTQVPVKSQSIRLSPSPTHSL